MALEKEKQLISFNIIQAHAMTIKYNFIHNRIKT